MHCTFNKEFTDTESSGSMGTYMSELFIISTVTWCGKLKMLSTA